MDSLSPYSGGGGAVGHGVESSGCSTGDGGSRWKQMGNEEKKAAINHEMKRVNQLPANSSYAIHRLRVLNKIMQLMSSQVLTRHLRVSYLFNTRKIYVKTF